MKAHAIVILNDGETWAGVDGSSICIISEDQLKALIEGEIRTRDLQPIVELGLRDFTPEVRS